MTTAGDNITKENITASMQALSSTFNAGIVWHAGNNPFTQNPTVVLAGGDSGGYPTLYGNPISDTNITASTISTNFRAYAIQLSRIRSTRWLQWYQVQGDARASLSSDVTNIASLNSDFQWDGFAGGPSAGQIIDASDLDDFVNYLSTNIQNHRTNTVLIEEFYCHSNCHGSCHGSL